MFQEGIGDDVDAVEQNDVGAALLERSNADMTTPLPAPDRSRPTDSGMRPITTYWQSGTVHERAAAQRSATDQRVDMLVRAQMTGFVHS
jgi:hypothetical protein